MPFNADNISPPFQFNVQSSHVSILENVFHFLIFAMVTMTVGTIQMKPIVQVISNHDVIHPLTTVGVTQIQM